MGRENDLEQLNRDALKIARNVADDTCSLMAGNICNTTVYTPGDSKSEEMCRGIFKVEFQLSCIYQLTKLDTLFT